MSYGVPMQRFLESPFGLKTIVLAYLRNQKNFHFSKKKYPLSEMVAQIKMIHGEAAWKKILSENI